MVCRLYNCIIESERDNKREQSSTPFQSGAAVRNLPSPVAGSFLLTTSLFMQNIHCTFISIHRKMVSCIRERGRERGNKNVISMYVCCMMAYPMWVYVQYCAKLLGTLKYLYILSLMLVFCTSVAGKNPKTFY